MPATAREPGAIRLARPTDQLAARYDVVVIGSGYGGGVAASRLARAGKRVVVVERGREVPTGSFPSRFPDMRHEVQVTGRRLRTGRTSALYDVRLGDDMHVLVGCGLGGGSLVNAAVALRPDARVFADPVWPGPIRQDGLIDEGYRRAAAWLRPAGQPGADSLTRSRSFAAATAGFGVAPTNPPTVVSYLENVNAAGVLQPACTLCGDCCAGCNVGAKNTVALTYLPDAVAHGAEIFVEIAARQIRRAGEEWEVQLERLDAEARDEDGPLAVRAPVVVLAAGTLGSTELLLRSRAAGLCVSDRLGERFSANGDIIAFGYGARSAVDAIGVGHPSKVPGHKVGAAVSYQLDLLDGDDLNREVRVQEGAMPSALAPLLPVMFVPNGRLVGALQSLISGVYKGPLASLQTFFAVSHDSSGGRLLLEDERLALNWPGARDEPVYARLDSILKSIVESAGGSYVKNPLAGTLMGHQPATAHPLGGCAMAETAGSGVVDHMGRVFSASGGDSTTVHDGLYVADGSVIPRSLGVNPLLTITALAERTMVHFGLLHGLRI